MTITQEPSVDGGGGGGPDDHGTSGGEGAGGGGRGGGGGGWLSGRRRIVAAGVVIAVVAAVVIAVIAWPRSSTTKIPKSAPLLPVPGKAITSTGGQEMIANVRAGAGTTYHATYSVTGDPSVTGGTLSLEVWQSPPNLREDTLLVTSAHRILTEAFVTKTGGRICVQQDKQPWSCRAVPANTTEAVGVSGVLASIANTVSGRGVVVSNDTIGGHAVQCFQVQSPDQPRLCLTSNGVPVLLSDTQVAYHLTTLATSVNKTVFSPPA